MTNLALGKKIEEEHYLNAQCVTDGQVNNYTGSKGFCTFLWPNYLTIDLLDTHPIKCIRFLLWDGLGTASVRDSRKYFYRVLTSIDHRNWDIIFDTLSEGYNGWQKLSFPTPVKARYIRVHGLYNSAKPHFHMVEFEVHDEEPPAFDAEYTLERTINVAIDQHENGDALPIEHNAQILIRKLEQLLEANTILNPVPIKNVISQLRTQVKDVSAIERNLESIRREITDPVTIELEKSSKLGEKSVALGKFSMWGFWVGLIGGLLAIISLILNIYFLVKENV